MKVRIVGRLLLATVLMLVQMGFGLAACACPEDAAAPLIKAAATCPMMKKGGVVCKCCCPSAVDKASANSIGAASQKCVVEVAKNPVGLKPALATCAPEILLDSPAPVSVIALVSFTELPVLPHMVVPRIRPPDPASHGLRAPPAR
jgi:hypothetical protein